ncbi:DMT family transporter [Asticcacaulis solisilvae]|uniref:DMT family transporter n=1 Tax=Asticcacaulis solisilvae TaxID=1217274 RepID=UPI003FD7E588
MRTVSRLQADLLLLLTAAIWGLAFVAQKSGLDGMGPFGFVGARFLLSTIVVLPLAWREWKGRAGLPAMTPKDWGLMGLLSLAFFAGAYLQQAGMVTASVTNAGFLTALYVVFVPVIGLFVFRHRQSIIVWPACAIAIAGVWLLNGGRLDHLSMGDALVIGCAAAFGLQINLMGIVVRQSARPFTICVAQNAVTAVAALALAGLHEHITVAGIQSSLVPILYAGIVSGGIGFALQAFAQQHTPSADAAIIMSGEALFAALSGAVLLHERLGAINWLGCGLIFAALLLVELYPYAVRAFTRPAN